jgi:hypothetical protein
MTTAARYAIVVALEFEPAWLALDRTERARYAALVLEISARHPRVSFRWFDADALGHGYTDFAICECDDLEAYHFLWEELRDTALFSVPYLRIRNVMLGLERGYERYETSHGQGRPAAR